MMRVKGPGVVSSPFCNFLLLSRVQKFSGEMKNGPKFSSARIHTGSSGARSRSVPFPKKNFVPLGFEYLLDMVCSVLESTDGPQKNYKARREKGDMPESAMAFRI